MMLRSVIFLALLLSPHLGKAQNSFSVSGFITDSASGEALIGASVYAESLQRGTATNSFGYYSIVLPKGTVDLQISYLGYAPRQVSVELGQDTSLSLALSSAYRTLTEVVVQDQRLITALPEVSYQRLDVDQINKLPSFFGEKDILKTVQLLPGVARGTEGSNELYVRGGSGDQNLILLDGIPVYNVNHAFGFLSVFNSDALNAADLYTGGFPARYGGRLSSVLDITMREGNRQKHTGKGSVGLLSAKGVLEGPINDRASYLLTARRTYFDIFTVPISFINNIESTGFNEVFRGHFYDLNAKVNYTLSDRSKLYLSYYGGQDKVRAGNISRFRNPDGSLISEYTNTQQTSWGNQTAGLRWNYLLDPGLFMNLTALYTRYDFDVVLEQNHTDPLKNEFYQSSFLSDIQDGGVKLDFDCTAGPQHRLRFGGSLMHQRFNPNQYSLITNLRPDTTIGSAIARNWQGSWYVEDEFRLGTKFSANIGLHYAIAWLPDRTYMQWQPRFSFNVQPVYWLGIKGSYARMGQFLHQLVTSGLGLPVSQWLPLTNTLGPQQGDIWTMGAIANVRPGINISVEGFYKTMTGLLEYRDGAGFTDVLTDWQDKVAVGEGESYGVEFLAEKTEGALTGWVSYTISRSWREFQELNFGDRFPYRFDRIHNASTALIYQIREGLSTSLTWTYTTGEALTLPLGQAAYPRIYQPVQPGLGSIAGVGGYNYYGGRNEYRMPDYHRLDWSLTWTRDRKKGTGTRSWNFGIYNVYGRRNPLYVDLQSTIIRDSTTGEYLLDRNFVQFSPVPLPVPFVSYEITF